MRRLVAIALALAGALSFSGGSASAQDWPSRPVRIVNTFAPGGAADILARLVADHLTGVFGQQFFVETKAGAAGVIGVASVAREPPDGYNFVITTVSLLTIAPLTNPKIGYDPRKDLTNIAYIAGSPIVFVVNAKSDVRTLADFIARGKTSDTPLTFSSSGVGSNGQLMAEFFGRSAGIKVEHVPYKGASQGLADLVGGHLAFSSQTVSSAAGLIRGNALRPIAHTAAQRLPDYPDVPTLRESGYPDLVSTNWFALAAPAGLAPEIARKINAEIVKLVTKPEVAARLRKDGMITEPMNVDEFGKFIDAETARWRPMLKAAGFEVR